MSTESKVVVIVTIDTYYDEGMGMSVARMPKLGITTYGKTDIAAERVAKELFAEKVQAHRETGHLRIWLDRTGLDWDWEEYYEGDLPFEDVSLKVEDDDPPTRPADAILSASPERAFGLAA